MVGARGEPRGRSWPALLGAALAVVAATALLDRDAARADFLYDVTLESNTLLRIDPATGAGDRHAKGTHPAGMIGT
jgi:hypothetical protein